jgi:hypothetical protein
MKEKVQNLCLPKFEGSPTRIIKTIIQIKVEEISYKPPSSIQSQYNKALLQKKRAHCSKLQTVEEIF